MSHALTFVPAAVELPPNTDVDSIVAELTHDHHVAAPQKDEAKLAAIVDDARDRGIRLSIVVIKKNPAHDSQLRDLATEVGKTQHGTVLVLSPDWVGTYSDSISRVKLENAEDAAKYKDGHPVTSARNFVDKVTEPNVPWTAITCVILALTVAIVAGLYYVKARRAHTAPPDDKATAVAVGPDTATD